MKVTEKQLCLYAVTDRTWLREKSLYEQVEAALAGGVTMVQLREKKLALKEFRKEAESINHLCKKYNVPLIINDNVELALAVGAAGVHIGQQDMDIKDARRILGEDKIIGVSARTVDQALAAWRAGADYLGSGAVFGTTTKGDASMLSLETFREICEAVDIPVVAIGGVTEENILKLKGLGAAGVAVVSAIFASEDIRGAARRLVRLSKEFVVKEAKGEVYQ